MEKTKPKMPLQIFKLVRLALILFCTISIFQQIHSQTKPPEHLSKVKKVLIYNFDAGWHHGAGIDTIKGIFKTMALEKNFELTSVDTATEFTLDFLQQFQVLVWNNNTNGGGSVPHSSSREALLQYLRQGGGWLLIHGAGDHEYSWPELGNLMGTGFAAHLNGPGEVVRDIEALNHKELKWMVEDMPNVLALNDQWQSYNTGVRSLPGITIIATSRGESRYVRKNDDGSDDYIWARQNSEEVGEGRLLFNSIGHNIVPPTYNPGGILNSRTYLLNSNLKRFFLDMYWENLRYAAGDYQNGCTNPLDSNYDPQAKVDDGSCGENVSLGEEGYEKFTLNNIQRTGRRIQLKQNFGPTINIKMKNLQGKLIWKEVVSAASNIEVPQKIKAGVYFLEYQWLKEKVNQKVFIP